MKRRRGSKKGRLKKQPKLAGASTGAVDVHTVENSAGADDDDVDSGTDAETEPTPSPPRHTQPETLAIADTLGRPNSSNIFGKAVYTRVKVKIKKSKTLESQRTSPSQSDTDKSSQQAGSEKPGLPPSARMEDSANSLSETNGQKAAGISIKSSRGLGSSSMSPCSNTEQPRSGVMVEKKDVKFLEKDSKHNEQELVSSLEVIIMLINVVQFVWCRML